MKRFVVCNAENKVQKVVFFVKIVIWYEATSFLLDNRMGLREKGPVAETPRHGDIVADRGKHLADSFCFVRKTI